MSSEIIKLNIGGTVFQTTKSTLTRFDGFFKTMLETDIPLAKDESGCIFIDRSPKHFDLILNFMRDRDVELPDSEKEVKEILKESEYYLLTGLVQKCQAKLESSISSTNLPILHTYDQVMEIIYSSETPVLIFYYDVTPSGTLDVLEDLREILEKYQKSFKVYLKRREYEFLGSTAAKYYCGCRASLHKSCNKRSSVIYNLNFLENKIQEFLNE